MEAQTKICAIMEKSKSAAQYKAQGGVRQRFASNGQLLLESHISDPLTHFIVDDTLVGILAMRFFERHSVRKVTVYHVGEKPRFNLTGVAPPYPTRNDFDTQAEIKAAMLSESSITIFV